MTLSSHFDAADFITHYWQKKPLVIRGLFNDFEDPLDEHELAGLAQEVEVEVDSRIVAREGEQWRVEHGPFEHFDDICQGAWSLLVQGVDRFSEPANALIKCFDFLPTWRTEDVMASFSVPQAGVGPHLDQYDVFIIQGKGSRRWKVGSKGPHVETIPHPRLRQIKPFAPIIDEVLYPGDAIYIPPGYAHDGIALEPCMNYSVGFRAPTQSELLSAFADHAIDNQSLLTRYGDPDLALRKRPGLILDSEINQFRNLLHSAIDSPDFVAFLGGYFSAPLCAEDSSPPVPFTEESTLEAMRSGALFVRALEARHIEFQEGQDFQLAVNGACFSMPQQDHEHAVMFVSRDPWQAEPDINYENCLFFVRFVTKLLNSGYWYLE